MSKIISGYAAVFESIYDMGDFDEMVAPGAFKKANIENCRFLRDHNPSLLLGRYKYGTLEVRADATGLFIRSELPDTALGDETGTLISIGVLREMSWGWTGTVDRWERRNGRQLRIITAVQTVWDCSVVTYPANPATLVQLEAPLFTSTLSGRAATFTTSTPVFDAFEDNFQWMQQIMDADARRVYSQSNN